MYSRKYVAVDLRRTLMGYIVQTVFIISILLMLCLDVRAQTSPWSVQVSGTTNSLAAVHFVSDNEGWIAGANATLLYTTDGGSHWAPVATGISTNDDFNAVRFLNQSVGWVGGFTSVIRTLDGGAHWNQALFQDGMFRRSLFPISPTMAVGGSGLNQCNPCGFVHLQYTFNPNGSFSQYLDVDYFLGTITVGSFAPIITDIYLIDANNGWSVGTFGRITRITNASSASPVFTIQTSGTSERLEGIHMLDANNGWVVGRNGLILRTIDSGNTWMPQISGTTMNLRGVHFKDLNVGWAVGDGGLILATSNGGTTWTPEPSGVTSDLKRVFFVNEGYVVGSDGIILKRSLPQLRPSGWVYVVGVGDYVYAMDTTSWLFILRNPSAGPWTYNYTTGLWSNALVSGWNYVLPAGSGAYYYYNLSAGVWYFLSLTPGQLWYFDLATAQWGTFD